MRPTLPWIAVSHEAPRYRVSLTRIRDTARKILLRLGWRRGGVSILLVTDSKIQSLNRRFLRHDRPTDIIALSHLGGPRMRPSSGSLTYLGDLIISLDTTRRQAARYGNTFFYELAFYICHGLLHLLGYRDDTKAGSERMDRKQQEILKKLGIQNQ